LTEDREAEAPFSHERQPTDDLPIFGYDRGAPRFPGEGIQPPWLLEHRVCACGSVGAVRRSGWSRHAGPCRSTFVDRRRERAKYTGLQEAVVARRQGRQND